MTVSGVGAALALLALVACAAGCSDSSGGGGGSAGSAGAAGTAGSAGSAGAAGAAGAPCAEDATRTTEACWNGVGVTEQRCAGGVWGGDVCRLANLQLVSQNTAGALGDDASSAPSVSEDCSKVVFQSSASNLVTGDGAGTGDVFLRDVSTGVTSPVSVGVGASDSTGSSRDARITPDGALVVFSSMRPNLVADDLNGVEDVFVRDLRTNVTQLITRASDGSQADGDSYHPELSDDGRFVVYASAARNLFTVSIRWPASKRSDVLITSREDGSTRLVSQAADRTSGDGTSDFPAISGDGRYVAFVSDSSNLGAASPITGAQIYLRDLTGETTTLLSAARDGSPGDGASGAPRMTSDGRYVVFSSEATNLVPGDTNGKRDVFVRELSTGMTHLVSLSTEGQLGDGDADFPQIAADGRYVAFVSTSTNLVGRSLSGVAQIFVRDLQEGTTTLAGLAEGGAPGNQDAMSVALSPSGRCLAFGSTATNLVSLDVNLSQDVFLAPL